MVSIEEGMEDLILTMTSVISQEVKGILGISQMIIMENIEYQSAIDLTASRETYRPGGGLCPSPLKLNGDL